MTILTYRNRASQKGMGIVETMIGILIGMIVVLVIYNVFAVAEGYKRTAVGAADAQSTGLYAQFVLSREIHSAGNGLLDSGIASSVSDLVQCTNNQAAWSNPAPFPPNVPPRIRPTPVLINDGGGPTAPDALIVAYSLSLHVISPVQFVDPVATGAAPFYVQSPNGFRVNDRVIAINPATQTCELTTVTNVALGDTKGDPTTGIVRLQHPNVLGTYTAAAPPDGSKLLNLGQQNEVARTLYDIANDQLRSTDLLAGAPANPIAQNVVLLKAQYGIDCLGNGAISWTTATASNICADGVSYTPNAVLAWNGPTLARMRAIRFGILVRSDEPDLKDPTLVAGTRAPVILFNCSANTNAGCPGRTVLPAGPVVALGSDDCAPAIICDTWRYRTYETIVPMRNAIWNNGL